MTNAFCRPLMACAATVFFSCSSAPEPGSVRLVARNIRFDAPNSVSAGLVRVRLVNHDQVWHHALLVKLKDSTASASAYVDSAKADVDFPAFALDVGGPGMVAPGDSADVFVVLEPGRYAVVCWFDSHLTAGMASELTVTPREGTAPSTPSPNVEVAMHDFAFQMTGALRAGDQLMRVLNRGPQRHELDVFRLKPGRTARDYVRWISDKVGEPPVIPAGGASDMEVGLENLALLRLQPGRYLFVCDVTDPASGKNHSQLGMVREVAIPAAKAAD